MNLEEFVELRMEKLTSNIANESEAVKLVRGRMASSMLSRI
jgi:hypothetical protein